MKADHLATGLYSAGETGAVCVREVDAGVLRGFSSFTRPTDVLNAGSPFPSGSTRLG